MNDTDDRRRLVAGVLIAGGALWLLVATGFIPQRLLLTLLGFWPLLPIGIGLDLLIERKPFDLSFTALALVAMVLLVFALPGTAPFEARFVEAVDGAERAEVHLDLSSAPTTLRPLVGSDLFRADIVDIREVRFESSGTAQRRLELGTVGGPGLRRAVATRPRWELRLGTDLPISLEIDVGSGRADLDLSGVELETLVLDGGSGAIELTLPAAEGAYAASFDLGSGAGRFATDPGAEVAILASTGSGASSWTFTRGSRITMNLETSSGSVTIDLPDSAGILLRIDDDGSGSVTIPDFLERLEGRGESGVWRSRGASEAAPEIVITVEDVGSGSLGFR